MHVSAETTSAQDWKLPANASFVILRFGSCYGDGDGQGTSWFAYPQMAEVFPGDGVGAGVDAAQGNNLVDFADFADLRTWQNGDLNIEATAWNDNKTTVMVRRVDGCTHRHVRALHGACHLSLRRDSFCCSCEPLSIPAGQRCLRVGARCHPHLLLNYRYRSIRICPNEHDEGLRH